ncbi:cupin domain-containing protein [Candidatus Acetothermia bacterium]|jgi:quercetin dioxygenase-like cupin family protein|nr:cupin domain-containing protein [Candidatus Acetothermia bacterium]MCI2432195.1 cupin domain-containing protein [Candidatus Acetothermia bacterium]MCI2436098.1 cupin domain-containing protein [Candidatus Acetothermia bacterium]
MAEYAQILQLADQSWEKGISPTITQKPMWTRADSNSHAQMMLVKMAPGGTSPAHRHPHPQLFYVISGMGIARLDGVEHKLKAGSVVRVFNGELHDFVNTGSEELVMIEVQIFDIKIDLKRVLEQTKQL